MDPNGDHLVNQFLLGLMFKFHAFSPSFALHERQKSSKESMCGRKPSKISNRPYSAAIDAKVAMTWRNISSDDMEKEDGRKGSNSRVSRKDVRIKKDTFTAPSCKSDKNQKCWSTIASLRQMISKMTSVGVKLRKICLLHGLSDPLESLYNWWKNHECVWQKYHRLPSTSNFQTWLRHCHYNRLRLHCSCNGGCNDTFVNRGKPNPLAWGTTDNFEVQPVLLHATAIPNGQLGVQKHHAQWV